MFVNSEKEGQMSIIIFLSSFWQLFPTKLFTILELQNPSLDIPELQKIRPSPDLEAPKLWKGLSGCSSSLEQSQAECVQTTKAQFSQPRNQLSLM